MSKAKVSVLVTGLLLLLLLISIGDVFLAETVHPSGGSSFLLERCVLSSGGCPGAATAFMSNGTLGQSTPLGEGLAGDKLLRTGFWAWPLGAASGLATLSAQPINDYLFQNVPNPFRLSTTIEYMLSEESMVRISVFNVRGQRVRTLVAENQDSGRHGAVWDGLDSSGQKVSPGIYFYRLDTDNYRTVRKMVLAR